MPEMYLHLVYRLALLEAVSRMIYLTLLDSVTQEICA